MIDKKRLENAVKEFLLSIGENPKREGLIDTPKRVSDMCSELFSGINSNPKKHIKLFEEPYENNNIIIIQDIPLRSVCEHHIMPFLGIAHIAYIPGNNKVLGISKFARIVETFSKKLQIQERLTKEISDFLFDELQPKGLCVIIEAEHLCMTMRGIKAQGSQTKTISFKGVFESDKEKKLEILTLMERRKNK